MSDSPTPNQPAPDADKQDAPKSTGDEPLGEGGKKALEAERDARRNAETELATLRGEFETFRTSLTEAFGVKPNGKDSSDTLSQVQEQLAQMKRDNSVLALANEHKITDKDDLDLLRATSDDEARSKLAARLASKAEDEKKPGTPKPDATQGAKGDPAKPEPGPGFPRLAAAYAASETTGTT